MSASPKRIDELCKAYSRPQLLEAINKTQAHGSLKRTLERHNAKTATKAHLCEALIYHMKQQRRKTLAKRVVAAAVITGGAALAIGKLKKPRPASPMKKVQAEPAKAQPAKAPPAKAPTVRLSQKPKPPVPSTKKKSPVHQAPDVPSSFQPRSVSQIKSALLQVVNNPLTAEKDWLVTTLINGNCMFDAFLYGMRRSEWQFDHESAKALTKPKSGTAEFRTIEALRKQAVAYVCSIADLSHTKQANIDAGEVHGSGCEEIKNMRSYCDIMGNTQCYADIQELTALARLNAKYIFIIDKKQTPIKVLQDVFIRGKMKTKWVDKVDNMGNRVFNPHRVQFISPDIDQGVIRSPGGRAHDNPKNNENTLHINAFNAIYLVFTHSPTSAHYEAFNPDVLKPLLA
jgi:hypothetical protein